MASEKIAQVLEQLSSFTLMDLSEFVSEFEKKFNVTAAAPVAVAMPGAGSAAAPAEEKVEKTTFAVHLAEVGPNKISVIKVIRAHTSLGLKEAKALVDAGKGDVKEGILKDEAEKIKKELEEAGAKAELK
ncbi:MAG: 50S ribosomal protein L7/L12 [Planctomycetota bacterium]